MRKTVACITAMGRVRTFTAPHRGLQTVTLTAGGECEDARECRCTTKYQLEMTVAFKALFSYMEALTSRLHRARDAGCPGFGDGS